MRDCNPLAEEAPTSTRVASSRGESPIENRPTDSVGSSLSSAPIDMTPVAITEARHPGASVDGLSPATVCAVR